MSEKAEQTAPPYVMPYETHAVGAPLESLAAAIRDGEEKQEGPAAEAGAEVQAEAEPEAPRTENDESGTEDDDADDSADDEDGEEGEDSEAEKPALHKY